MQARCSPESRDTKTNLYCKANTTKDSDPGGRLPADFPAWLESRCPRVEITPLAEFKNHGFDPAVMVQEDRQNLTLSALVSENPQRPQWMKEVLGPPGVAFGNPDSIAKQFYQRFIELRV